MAKIKERFRLNKVGSTKETWHVVLDLSGSNISYKPGDSFGILPDNDPELVQRILQVLGFTGVEEYLDSRSQTVFHVKDWLQKKANVSGFSSRFIQFLADHLDNVEKKERLQALLNAESHDALKHVLSTHDVYDMLKLYEIKNVTVDAFCKALQPMLPRFYSVASSQTAVKDEVHFLVARVRYEVEGHKRLGVCSHFLCDMAPLMEPCIPVYVQPTKDFVLPENSETPIIMIGPGTGVAPYRAFMQERVKKSSSYGCNWLIFGERNRNYDYFYEEYWSSLVLQKKLLLDTAFSRDYEQKHYVQHIIWEKREQFWDWLQKGAMVYVCGDAHQMAKDVDKVLFEIIKEKMGHSDDAAKAYMSDMRKQKRYLRDVY